MGNLGIARVAGISPRDETYKNMGKPLITNQCGHPNDGFGQEGRALTKNFRVKIASISAQIQAVFPYFYATVAP